MNDQKKNIVICDIDGTIANNDHRQHLLKNFKDWDKFFSQLHLDKPIYEIIDKVIGLNNKGKKIIFITGRPEKYREQTLKWLKNFFNFNFCLIMRSDDDLRSKVLIKEELFKLHFQQNEVFIVFENDQDLINLWKKLDLNVFQVS